MSLSSNTIVINCGSTKTPFFKTVLERIGAKCTIVDYSIIGSINFDSYSHIIISGAPILVTEIDYSEYLKSFKSLLTINKPVLGVCFGHQILGLLHGASAFKCEEDRAEQDVVVLHSLHKLFSAFTSPIVSFAEDHCECISLPASFDLSASSDICENEAMQHKTKPMFGVQFHPEVSGYNGELLLRNFISI